MVGNNFIVIGENIHCSRIVKRGGVKTSTGSNGGEGVQFCRGGEERLLPVPSDWAEKSSVYGDGKIKHVALALYHCLEGAPEEKKTGEDYLLSLAERQIAAGADYLDVNVDEFSAVPVPPDEVMEYLVGFLTENCSIPLSIDSSDVGVLRSGLQACSSGGQSAILNSVSLERVEAVDLAAEFTANVVVSASGATGLPSGVDERMVNFRRIVGKLDDARVPRPKMHLDPLVLPVSTDSQNGLCFLEATSSAASEFDDVHLTGGLSNISFGLPNRKLLNMVFVSLCMEAGTDGGIIDPVTVPLDAVAKLDPEDESFGLARKVLTGEDMFGMEYITAFREERL